MNIRSLSTLIFMVCLATVAAVSGSDSFASAQSGGQASVSAAGNTTTITGKDQQTIPAIKLDLGVYAFKWSSTSDFLSLTVNAAAGGALGVLSLADPSGENLFAVDGERVKPGAMQLEVSSSGPWTITITKADAASAVALPQTLSGAEMKTIVSKPFKANAGPLRASYAYKDSPRGTGTLGIFNVITGKQVVVKGMMVAGKISGELGFDVPAAGVYIAKTTFPLGSKGGDVTLGK